MSILFSDGCGEYYPTADLLKVWTSQFGVTVQPTSGRRGGACFRMTANNHGINIGVANSTTVFMGVAYKFDGVGAANEDIMSMKDGSTVAIELILDSSNNLSVETGATIHGVTTGVPITSGVWQFIEMSVVVHDTTGIVIVKVDGTEVLNLTGLDTKPSGVTDINVVGIGGIALDLRADDVYVCDDAGSAPYNTFLGDIQIDPLFPDADGTKTEFDTTFPASPTDHYSKVDETGADDDTTYNETPTANDIDLFDFPAVSTISGGSDFLAVKLSAFAKKTDGTLQTMQLISMPVATEYAGSVETLSTSYNYYSKTWELNPETGVAWTDALFNASEFGVESL